jgi:DNA-binding GntR family transcriptional regulator
VSGATYILREIGNRRSAVLVVVTSNHVLEVSASRPPPRLLRARSAETGAPSSRFERLHIAKDDVVAIIYPKLDPEVCRRCTARILPQCEMRLPNGEQRNA